MFRRSNIKKFESRLFQKVRLVLVDWLPRPSTLIVLGVGTYKRSKYNTTDVNLIKRHVVDKFLLEVSTDRRTVYGV